MALPDSHPSSVSRQARAGGGARQAEASPSNAIETGIRQRAQRRRSCDHRQIGTQAATKHGGHTLDRCATCGTHWPTAWAGTVRPIVEPVSGKAYARVDEHTKLRGIERVRPRATLYWYGTDAKSCGDSEHCQRLARTPGGQAHAVYARRATEPTDLNLGRSDTATFKPMRRN